MNEKTLKDTTVFDGHLIRVHVDDVELDNGMVAKREIVSHPGGVSVAILTEKNELLFVKQFRCPYQEELLELPAGKLEPGEDPVSGALRELKEETGAVPDTFLPMGVVLPSPGCLGERLHLFLARGLHMEKQHLDEDEFLNVERIPFSEMVHRVMDGEIEDGKTIAAVLKAKVLLDL